MTLAEHAKIPPGYTGFVNLPGSDRLVFWTGRVAIGLRFDPEARRRPSTESEAWIQGSLINDQARRFAS